MKQQQADAGASIPRYGRWHGEFDPQTQADRVVFAGPDGAAQRRPTFLHQPAALTYDEHGYESVAPHDAPVLAARFTPTEPGQYRYLAMAANEVVAEGGFRCEPSEHPGYVQRSSRDPRYFAFTNGDSYCAIGLNLCCPSGWGRRALGAPEYRRWFRQLSEAGGNFARLWVSVPYFNAQGQVAGELDRAIFAMVKAKSPRNLVTNSIGSFDMERYQAWYDDFKMDEMDFQQVHRYLDQGAPWAVCHHDGPAFSKDAVERARRPDRPVLFAETGAVDDGHSGPFRYYQSDHRGIIFHDTTYPAFFAGAAGTGHIWHWDQYVDCKNLWGAYRPFADLVAGVKLDQEQFQALDLSSDALWVFALLGKEHLLLWARNRADSWYRVLRDDMEPEVLRSQRVDLTELAVREGEVTTIWPWGEDTGRASLKAGVLTLPPFRHGLLVKVRR